MARMLRKLILSTIVLVTLPQAAHAAPIQGAAMGWAWALPFVGILLSIATGPLLFPKVWHRHYGKIAFAWGLLTLVPLALFYGPWASFAAFVHAMLAEYLSFIVLLFTLYTVAGGILVRGNIRGTPLANTGMIGLGTLMASLVGTTGAAMILIRPLLHANAARPHNAHVVVFFIILVANVGGALTPLGDPPLFVGFLRGVEFFWPAQHIWMQTLLVAGIVLAVFVLVDWWFYRRERHALAPGAPTTIRVFGTINFLLIGLVLVAILVSAAWEPGIEFDIFGTKVALQNFARDAALLCFAGLSLWLTPNEHRESNEFTWEPIREVAKLFAAIFITIIPVLAMLSAGHEGPFAWLLATVTAPDGAPREAAYFWLTGILSAFLDNAPTYLVFFELAGGDATRLMGSLAATLAAISMGAVYMGALTYLGNAPNFMVYAIATERGIRMPSFFGYMLWASIVLVPVFVLLTVLPIAPILRW
jgi:Na+/H+ antiporter NhaD/arsenite permease-like protein